MTEDESGPTPRFPQKINQIAKTIRHGAIIANYVANNPDSLVGNSRRQIISKAVRADAANKYGEGEKPDRGEITEVQKTAATIKRIVNDPNNKAVQGVVKFISEAGARPSDAGATPARQFVGKNLRRMAGRAILKGAKKIWQDNSAKPSSNSKPRKPPTPPKP
jgi:hypothetical protein